MATRSLAADAKGQTGAAVYPYVSGAKLLSVIRPKMDELGLLLTQEVVEIQNTPLTYPTKNGEKMEMFTCVKIKFTWIDTEDGSTIENYFYANGMNAWDKGLGSALTYAERYFLMKTFHLSTSEDDVDALVKDEAIRENPVQAQVQAQEQPQQRIPRNAIPINTTKKQLTNKVAKELAEKLSGAIGEKKWDDIVTKANHDYEISQEQWNRISAMIK